MGPEEGGERYQHFEEIVGALRAQIFRSELMHLGFQWILVVAWVGSLEIGTSDAFNKVHTGADFY